MISTIHHIVRVDTVLDQVNSGLLLTLAFRGQYLQNQAQFVQKIQTKFIAQKVCSFLSFYVPLESKIHRSWNYAVKVLSEITRFLERILLEHAYQICSLVYAVFITICSIRTRSRKRDIFEKSLQPNFKQSVFKID